MKRLQTIFLLATACVATAFAQDSGTGFVGNDYYRIHNFATGRYIYVTDNKDNYDITHDQEDFQAIQLWKDANKAISAPASVIYIKQVGSQYDLMAQGSGVHALTGYYVNVNSKGNGVYEVYAQKDGVTKYLSDDRTSDRYDQGKMGTGGKLNYRRWVVDKIETNHAINYVGIKPTIELNGKYYQPYYASYPFKAASPDMHIYYVSMTDGDMALLQEIEGEVPASTPVLIECTSANTSDNRIELLASTSATVTGNKLAGVYFCNGERPKSSTDAYKIFDAAKMRIFSVENGKLVLTDNAPDRLANTEVNNYTTWETEWVKCIPANTCYFKANASTPSVIELTSDPTSIGTIGGNTEKQQAEGVYSLSGTRLRTTNNVEGLPAGLYIVGGRKMTVK